MLEAIAEIQDFTNGMTFEEFQNVCRRHGGAKRKTIRAVLYNLAIIGEAVVSIPSDVEAAHPEIPWIDIRGMRNIVIHEYFQVNLPIIWQTIQTDLAQLEASLQSLLEE